MQLTSQNLTQEVSLKDLIYTIQMRELMTELMLLLQQELVSLRFTMILLIHIHYLLLKQTLTLIQ